MRENFKERKKTKNAVGTKRKGTKSVIILKTKKIRDKGDWDKQIRWEWESDWDKKSWQNEEWETKVDAIEIARQIGNKRTAEMTGN